MQRVEQNEGTQDLRGGLCRPIDSCLSTTLDSRLEKAAELFARPFTAILWAATFTNRSSRALNCSGKPLSLSLSSGRGPPFRPSPSTHPANRCFDSGVDSAFGVVFQVILFHCRLVRGSLSQPVDSPPTSRKSGSSVIPSVMRKRDLALGGSATILVVSYHSVRHPTF